MVQTNNPGDVAATFFRGLADRDVDAAFSVVAPDAEIAILPLGVQGRAADEGRAFFDATAEAFPDLLLTVRNTMTVGAGVVVTELKLEGTQAADYLGVVNQEKHLDVDQAWVLDVSDGLVRGIRGFWCENQLYRRLAVKRLDQIAIV